MRRRWLAAMAACLPRLARLHAKALLVHPLLLFAWPLTVTPSALLMALRQLLASAHVPLCGMFLPRPLTAPPFSPTLSARCAARCSPVAGALHKSDVA